MKRLLLLFSLATLACGGSAPDRRTAPLPYAGPFSVILLIGDGTGLHYWSAAKLALAGPLGVEALPVVGLVDTESVDGRITDSAAGATAYATGVRTFNRVVGLAPDSTTRVTVLEVAAGNGWATGLVVTSSVTHATPASFAAHVPSRYMNQQIAEQMAGKGLDVLLGGGRDDFDPGVRTDGQDLLARLSREAAYVQDAEAFFALDMDTVRSLVGLFAEGHPGPAASRSPSLPELTRAALSVLERDDDGFFLMVEGSQIDWRGEENAPLQEVIAEMYDFDLAIRTALEFQRTRPNTLIVVTADHDTGGLALHGDSVGRMAAHYTTIGHTAGLVPLFAGGPGAAAFAGIRDNDEVGRLLLGLVRDGGAATAPRP